MAANGRWRGKNLHSKIYMPVILLCIQLLSPHVKGETLTLSHVIMGFLKWHSGSKKRKKRMSRPALSPTRTYSGFRKCSCSLSTFVEVSLMLKMVKYGRLDRVVGVKDVNFF